MSKEVKIQLSAEAQKTVRDVGTFPVKMLMAVAKTMDGQNLLTVTHIHRKYLSFPQTGKPTPLGLRRMTGRYRDSLFPSPAKIESGVIQSSIGSNVLSKGGVSYPAVHEFGFDGDVSVSPHLRKKIRSQVIFGKTRKVRGADIGVGHHSRHMHLPARAPIQRGIADRLPAYQKAFGLAIAKEWNS